MLSTLGCTAISEILFTSTSFWEAESAGRFFRSLSIRATAINFALTGRLNFCNRGLTTTSSAFNRIVRARNATPTCCGSMKLKSVGLSHAQRIVFGVAACRDTAAKSPDRERAMLKTNATDENRTIAAETASAFRWVTYLFMMVNVRMSLHHGKS